MKILSLGKRWPGLMFRVGAKPQLHNRMGLLFCPMCLLEARRFHSQKWVMRQNLNPITIKGEQNDAGDNYLVLNPPSTINNLYILSVAPYYRDRPKNTESFHKGAEGIFNLFSCFAQKYRLAFNGDIITMNSNKNLTCSITDLINDRGKTLNSSDHFVFYFNGHGGNDFLEVDNPDGGFCNITSNDLKEALTPIANRGVSVIIIIDACDSGSFIDNLSELGSKANIFTSSSLIPKFSLGLPNASMGIYTNIFIKINKIYFGLDNCVTLSKNSNFLCIDKNIKSVSNSIINWSSLYDILRSKGAVEVLIGQPVINLDDGSELIMSYDMWDPGFYGLRFLYLPIILR